MYCQKGQNRRYIIDDYTVSYAPSAKILQHCQQRKRSAPQKLTILQANPEDTAMLPHSYREIEDIRALFPKSRIVYEATENDLAAEAQKAHILHICGHADSRGITLHDKIKKKKKKDFLLEDIFATIDMPAASLVTLSACETGMLARRYEHDEYVSLTSAFLYAGSSAVVSSLWPVSDISTSLLMKKMYECLKAGCGKAEALRQAQLWLKNYGNDEAQKLLPVGETLAGRLRFWRKDLSVNADIDFSQPYHWAGFICSGV
jgi:CHAT domain-containing protein